jgi:hypothetical protein
VPGPPSSEAANALRRLALDERAKARVLGDPRLRTVARAPTTSRLTRDPARETRPCRAVCGLCRDALIGSAHRCSIATHDEALQQRAAQSLRARGVPADGNVEFETLQGLGEEGIDALRDVGFRTRVYVVFGEEWFLYVCDRMGMSAFAQAVADALA